MLRAVPSSSRHLAVLFSGRGSVVARMRSVSAMMRLSVASSFLFGMNPKIRKAGAECKRSLFFSNTLIRHYPVA